MDGKRLDLNLLVTLEALLSEQNVTRAAARLHLSQPAVSAQLNRLRQLFDDPLLIPAQRGMTPTVRALALRAPLQQALDQLRETLGEHQAFDPLTAKLTVSLACSDYAQWAVVRPLLLVLRRQAPEVRIALRQLDLRRVEAQLASGEIDAALITPHMAPPGLRSRVLFRERYVLIGRRGHKGLHAGLSAAGFAALEQIVVSPGGGGFVTEVDTLLASQGLSRRVVLSAASFLIVPKLVAQSELVALVPWRLVADDTAPFTIVDCPLPVAGFDMALCWHERVHGHVAHRWLRDQCAAVVSAPDARHSP